VVCRVIAKHFPLGTKNVVFVTDAACEFDPVKMLEYLNRECPADSRAIPELASSDPAILCRPGV
jgi:hypothetical protein